MSDVDELVPPAPTRQQTELPSPKDMERATLARIAEQEQPIAPVKQEAVKPEVVEAKSEEITEQQIAMLDLKLKSGTELTEEEKALASKIDSEITIEAPKVYKIAGQEVTSLDLEKKFLAEYPTYKFDGMPATEKHNLIDMYAKAQNRSEASRAIDNGQKVNAQERDYLRQTRVSLEVTAKTLLDAQNAQVQQYQELEKLALSAISDQDIYMEDGRIDFAKAQLLMNKNNALQQLPKVNQEITRIKNEIQSTRDRITDARITELISAHAEYKTSEPIDILLMKMERNDPSVTFEDKIKVKEISEMLSQINPSMGIDIEDVYQYKLRSNTLAVKPVAQTTQARTVPELPKAETLLQKVEAYKQRSKTKTPLSGTGAPTEQPKISTARQLINHAHETLGGNTVDPLRKEFSYL